MIMSRVHLLLTLFFLFVCLPVTGFAQEKSRSHIEGVGASHSNLFVQSDKKHAQPLSMRLFGRAPAFGAVAAESDSMIYDQLTGSAMPFSVLFKFDTSPANPEVRCYDIRKPLTDHYTFLFNFLSNQQYNIETAPR